MGRFSDFTDDELYMLKRQAIESSSKIVMMDDYSDEEKQTHNNLMNEIIDEIKFKYGFKSSSPYYCESCKQDVGYNKISQCIYCGSTAIREYPF